LIEYLKVLADPTRMKILKFLLEEPVYVCELAEVLGISQPTVSQHLRRLKGVGLVEENREGRRICYQISRQVFERYQEELKIFLDTPINTLPEMSQEWTRYLEAKNKKEILACKELQ